MEVRYGTFAGKTLVPVNIMGSATLRNGVTQNIVAASKPNPLRSVVGLPMPGPARSFVPVTTRDDSPLPHVTVEPVTNTPDVNSRGATDAQGNMQGKTVPALVAARNFQIRIVPGFGVGGGGINGRLVTDHLPQYSNTAPIPSYNSGNNQNSPLPAINPKSNVIIAGSFKSVANLDNPNITQNDSNNPRLTVLSAPNPNTQQGANQNSSKNHTMILLVALVIAFIVGWV